MHCRVGWAMLCSLPAANGGCWSKQVSRQFEADLTVMLKISPLSVCVCVCPSCRFKKSTSNLDLPEPLSRREKTLPRCSAPKGQPNVTFDLFSSAHKKKKNKKRWQKWGILKWLLMIMADISGERRSTDDFGHEKALMWQKVKVDFRSQL